MKRLSENDAPLLNENTQSHNSAERSESSASVVHLISDQFPHSFALHELGDLSEGVHADIAECCLVATIWNVFFNLYVKIGMSGFTRSTRSSENKKSPCKGRLKSRKR